MLPLLFIFFLLACHKDPFTTDTAMRLTASADSIRFDTVFTNTGSATQAFKIFNTNKEGIRIAAIRLLGGAASPFKINGNGTPGPDIENLEIAANDSVYVFVTVTIPVQAARTPFIVQDSIEIHYNGNIKRVQLEAYAQNAHFLHNAIISGNEVWNNDLPYVLLGSCIITEKAHVTITEGCRIFAHAGAALVVNGQLTVQGKKWDSTRVVFTGDRLDEPYRHLPGSWPGILFKAASHDNSLQYAVIKNANRAIEIEASPAANKLTIGQTIIDNASGAGIVADNSNLTAENLLISNCGKSIVLQNGGTYLFTQATIAGFSTFYQAHKEPLLTINTTGSNSLDAVFRNCIFWSENNGLVKEEVQVNKTGTGPFRLAFDGVLWPQAWAPENAAITHPIVTTDPAFEEISPENKRFDFHLKETSSARNSGVPAGVSLDLDGHPRPATAPDLGAYQKQ